jgi:hypothetical protein
MAAMHSNNAGRKAREAIGMNGLRKETRTA